MGPSTHGPGTKSLGTKRLGTKRLGTIGFDTDISGIGLAAFCYRLIAQKKRPRSKTRPKFREETPNQNAF